MPGAAAVAMSPAITGMAVFVGLGAQLLDHRTGQLDAGHRHAALGQRNGDAPGADGELQRSAVTGKFSQSVDGRPSTSAANMPVPGVSYRWASS